MLAPEEGMDIKALRREGRSLRRIAQLTVRSRNTVKKILAETAPQPYARRPTPSKLDAFYWLSIPRLFSG